MPVHDWTRLPASVFLHFRLCWLVGIRIEIDRLLPADHCALIVPDAFDPEADPARKVVGHRAVAVFHQSSTRRLAVIDVAPPEAKERDEELKGYARRAAGQLEAGVNLLVIDIFPQAGPSPQRAPDTIWFQITGSHFQVPTERPLTVAAFAARPRPEAYLEPLRVGDSLPDMPLFLGPDRCVPVPLESTYLNAFAGVPRHFREVFNDHGGGPANGT